MSDTPRTDAEAFWPHDSKEKVCDAVFARQLEGELNAANAAVAEAAERLAEQHMRIAQLEQENDAMRADLLLWENGGPLP
jgi:hypothetical protein